MAKDSKEVNTEKYQGPGRVASAIGSGTLWSIPASIVSGVAAIPAIKSVMDNPNLRNFSEIKGKGIAVAGAVAGLGMTVYGYVNGWSKAAKAKKQFEALKAQVGSHEARAEALEMQVNGLNEEVSTHRKRFTDMHQSRAEHGSHAQAALHDKHEAKSAEQGV